MTATRTSVTVRVVAAREVEALAPSLATILIDIVAREASLGFLPPLSRLDAEGYWLSLIPELRAGSRLLVGAFCNGQVVGSGQLFFPRWPNARHRAELQKLFLDAALQGQGVGRLIMDGLHASALEHGRSLILLNARRSVAARFYKPLGYREVGVIPGYSLGSTGERIDSTSLYLDLGDGRRAAGD